MSEGWHADRHADGWAVYRRRSYARVAFRLPFEAEPLVFELKGAAVVWAEILNERAAAGLPPPTLHPHLV